MTSVDPNDPYCDDFYEVIPVLIPESILKFDLPLRKMEDAIIGFNTRLQIEKMVLTRDDAPVKIEVLELLKREDDLFVKLSIHRHWFGNSTRFSMDMVKHISKFKAKMTGYIIMDRETSEVDQLVIEGFKFVRL
jgi:hypothetical protein